MHDGDFLRLRANKFCGGVIGHGTFLNSWGYNFVSFKVMSLKLIQATILELIPEISWIKSFYGYQSRDSRGQLKILNVYSS